MRVTPPQSDPQAQAQQPQAQPDQDNSPAAQAVQMIQQGYIALGKIIQSAGGSLPPEDIKLFQTAAQATDALLQSLSGPSGGQGGPPPPSGPMAQNANAKAQPVGPQG